MTPPSLKPAARLHKPIGAVFLGRRLHASSLHVALPVPLAQPLMPDECAVVTAVACRIEPTEMVVLKLQ